MIDQGFRRSEKSLSMLNKCYQLIILSNIHIASLLFTIIIINVIVSTIYILHAMTKLLKSDSM